jgi:hypothetical protein
MTKEQINSVLEGVRSWPNEDQEELAEFAREIEARRTGLYALSEDERSAIAEAEKEEIVPDDKVREFWKQHGIA